MGIAAKHAILAQIGEEVTPGTAVAATRRLAVRTFTFDGEDDVYEHSDVIDGLLTHQASSPLIVKHGSSYEMRMDLDFEQILWPLMSGLEGGVTPTQPDMMNAPNTYLWTFTPPVDSDPTLDAYTVEFASRAGADVLDYESPYVMCRELEISARNENVPEVVARFFGRKFVASTVTPALAVPTLSDFPALLTKVYIDDTWANLGMTQITGQVKSFRWRWANAVRPEWFLDGRADLDLSTHVIRRRTPELEMRIAVDPAANQVADDELTQKRASAGRAVRIEMDDGVEIDVGGALNRYVHIDGFYYHTSESVRRRGEDEDGNLILDLRLRGAYETSQAQDTEVRVENNLSSWPS